MHQEDNTISFDNSIIIIDEAHDVPEYAEHAASFQLDTDSMAQLVLTLKKLQDSIGHSG